MDKQLGKSRRKVAGLTSEIANTEEQEREEEQILRLVQKKLESSLQQLSRKNRSLSETERALKATEQKRKQLKDDLALCRKRYRQLELEGSTRAGNKGGAEGLLATKDSLGRRLEETVKEIRALRGRRLANRRALQKLDEKISSLRSERDESSSRRDEIREQLRTLKRQLKAAEEDLRCSHVPLRRQENVLFGRLGEDLLSNRSDEPELAPFFSSLDLSASTIENLENDIRSEEVLLRQLNRDAVIAFYATLSISGFFILLLATLAITLIIVLL